MLESKNIIITRATYFKQWMWYILWICVQPYLGGDSHRRILNHRIIFYSLEYNILQHSCAWVQYTKDKGSSEDLFYKPYFGS